ncbi:DUF7667 family protein [Paenibacillus pasadenensis]|uniref:DUF7667 family protein n=1 Tax=Paenibacillus pasadenensis TaxID=217090 RepID=UPI0005BDA295|nr:hypothetical protein [Paenibacillus pasadenensis]
MVKSFHARLAELYTINKRREMSCAELAEIDHCLQQNAKYVHELAYLENLSIMASMTSDVDWQHEICRDIDDLMLDPHASKTKKPGSR